MTDERVQEGWGPPRRGGRTPITRRPLRFRAASALLAVGLGAACSSEPPTASGGPVTQLAEASDAIGPELMVFLGQAKNFHHKAKVYTSEGKLDEAIASVRQILSLPYPPGAPEADDVRLDARARLATLLLNQNQPEEAMRIVTEGLAPTQRESFFVANLYTVQGEIHEAFVARHIADNQPARADAERRAALEAYDRSIKINEKIQKRLMEDR